MKAPHMAIISGLPAFGNSTGGSVSFNLGVTSEVLL